MGVVRDPAINEPMIEIPRERRRLEAFRIASDASDPQMIATR